MKTITIEIPEILLKAVKPLLEQASQNLGNNGCNDYELKDSPEMQELVEAAVKHCCGEELVYHKTVHQGKLLTQDFVILDYFLLFLERQNCDWCGESIQQVRMEPEEAGETVCPRCYEKSVAGER